MLVNARESNRSNAFQSPITTVLQSSMTDALRAQNEDGIACYCLLLTWSLTRMVIWSGFSCGSSASAMIDLVVDVGAVVLSVRERLVLSRF